MKNTNYLNENEVAKLLGISVKKLQKDRVRREGVPYHKFGRAVRYGLADVEAWANAQRVEPLPSA